MITQNQLLEYLKTNNISYDLFTHIPLFTCEQAEQVVTQMGIPGMGIKNLFLKDDKKNLYHIIAAYNTQVSLKALASTLHAKGLRFADATLLMQYLGVEPGSVTPMALINDKEQVVRIIVDASIFEHALLQMHPLKNDATIVITPDSLLKFFELIHRPYTVYDFVQNQAK